MKQSEDVREQVRQRYAAAASAVIAGSAVSCCDTAADCGMPQMSSVAGSPHRSARRGPRQAPPKPPLALPAEAVAASPRCGDLSPSPICTRARRCSIWGSWRRHRRTAVRASSGDPSGMAYGVDMTDEMLTLAR